MKCFILVKKPEQPQTPIMDCAAIILTGREQLIVTEAVGELVLKKYPQYVTKIGACEKDSLRHGRFELEPLKTAGDVEPEKQPPSRSLKSKTSDRSMAGKGKKRAKKKGK